MEQNKASIMAMVSHELKAPLHGIVGLSNSLHENEDLPSNIVGVTCVCQDITSVEVDGAEEGQLHGHGQP